MQHLHAFVDLQHAARNEPWPANHIDTFGIDMLSLGKDFGKPLCHIWSI